MSALKPISLPVAFPVGLVGLTPALRKGVPPTIIINGIQARLLIGRDNQPLIGRDGLYLYGRV